MVNPAMVDAALVRLIAHNPAYIEVRIHLGCLRDVQSRQSDVVDGSMSWPTSSISRMTSTTLPTNRSTRGMQEASNGLLNGTLWVWARHPTLSTAWTMTTQRRRLGTLKMPPVKAPSLDESRSSVSLPPVEAAVSGSRMPSDRRWKSWQGFRTETEQKLPSQVPCSWWTIARGHNPVVGFDGLPSAVRVRGWGPRSCRASATSVPQRWHHAPHEVRRPVATRRQSFARPPLPVRQSPQRHVLVPGHEDAPAGERAMPALPTPE